MIEVSKYKYFHGDLITNNGETIRDSDFIYDPIYGVWVCDSGEYSAETSVAIDSQDLARCEFNDCFNSESNKCKGVEVSIFGIPVDSCEYEVIEKHENVTVEVLKCIRCGHVELSWYNPEELGEDI